jgi:rubrerythrin
MIAQRHTSQHPTRMNEESMLEAVMAWLNRPVGAPRWDCDVCGMIHMGPMPLACESCGSRSLSRQADFHHEMNNHW